MAERLILINPSKGCKLSKLEKKEMKILPQEKIGVYLAEAERRGLLPMFYLELTTGLRRGELLALLWTDLDIEAGTISVTKQVNRINGELVVSQPKTSNSIRTLAIPRQAVELLIEEHKKHPHSPYMFPSPKTGTMYDPDSFRHTHDKILKTIGVEHIRFHDLRHTFATLSLKNGVDVKTLSGALGHYSEGFTLNTYTHATTQMKRTQRIPLEMSSVRRCKNKKCRKFYQPCENQIARLIFFEKIFRKRENLPRISSPVLPGAAFSIGVWVRCGSKQKRRKSHSTFPAHKTEKVPDFFRNPELFGGDCWTRTSDLLRVKMRLRRK